MQPILLIVWRRPASTQRVLHQIREISPERLYVACDGPRAGDDAEKSKVDLTRQVISESIDWPCHVSYLYSDYNQGCRLGVSNAISWFFQHESEGIILEDDCVPHPDFFAFCDELLERFRHDPRVWWISGTNGLSKPLKSTYSYHFSRYGHCWGWASWRDRWARYDRDLVSLGDFLGSHGFHSLFAEPRQSNFWASQLLRLRDERYPDTWDYQWSYTCLINSGLAVVPNFNLVTNIGFDADATHTKKPYGNLSSQSVTAIMPLTHPDCIVPSLQLDNHIFSQIYATSFLMRLLRKAKSIYSFLTRHES